MRRSSKLLRSFSSLESYEVLNFERGIVFIEDTEKKGAGAHQSHGVAFSSLENCECMNEFTGRDKRHDEGGNRRSSKL